MKESDYLSHLSSSASSSLSQVGDCILSTLSGKRTRVSQKYSTDCLNPPDPTEVPVCVMDGTDVETIVVTSEWTAIELPANQTREDDCEVGDNSLSATECHQSTSQCNENTDGNEIRTKKHHNTENYLGESTPAHDNHFGSISEERTAEAEQLEDNVKERLSLSCSVMPLDSTLTAPVTADVFTNSAGTRRSARKPKKTWKLKLVTLQKQKRKPVEVTGQNQERKPLAPMRNSRAVTGLDAECVASDNRSVHGF